MAGGVDKKADRAWVFDPTDPAFIKDPYPGYAWLRAHDPVHWTDQGYWVVSRHDDVKAVLRDPRFGQGEFINNIQLFYDEDFDVLSHPAYRWLSQIFVMQDPPQHTRLRGLVVKALTARRVEAMRPRIQAITDQLIDRFLAGREAEFVHDFAYRLPTTVMCDMLGMTEDQTDDALLAKLNQAIADSFIVFETRAFSAAELARADAQIEFLTDYFFRLFEARAKAPGDDLTTALLQVREGGDALSREEMAVIVIGLFGAGFETTAHMLGNGLKYLHQNPAQWRLLCQKPELAAQATDEALRFESSLQATYRTALEDADIAGTPIKQGQRVLTLLAAANRDAAAYDDPDRFDITRPVGKTLSFGGGIHYCVGAQLARLEGEIAFATLARRLPDMRIDLDNAPWRAAFFFRGLTQLPIDCR